LRAVVATLLMSSLLAVAGSAQAQPPAPAKTGLAGDVRCMLTMAALSGNKANQPQAGLGIFYFAGRIKAQSPNFNFGSDLKPVAAKMTQQDFESEVARCGPMVVSVVQGLQAAQAAFGPPPSAPGATPPAPAPAPKK